LSFLRFWAFMAIRFNKHKNEHKNTQPKRHVLRFNFKHLESAISQHSMDDLAFSLVKHSNKINAIDK